MQKFVALLRGINVSGQKKIPMADLKKGLARVKELEEIQTYIQSGNIVFSSNESDPKKLSQLIHQVIEKQFGFDVPVLVVSQAAVLQIPTLNPYLSATDDTKALYVGFMYDIPAEHLVEGLKGISTGNDQYDIVDSFMFMKYNEGIGKSKMDNNFFERKLKIQMSTRNWNTVLKLGEM